MKKLLLSSLILFSMSAFSWHFTDTSGNIIGCNSGEVPVVNVFGTSPLIFGKHPAFKNMSNRGAFEHTNGSAKSCQKCKGLYNGKKGKNHIMRCAKGKVNGCSLKNPKCSSGHLCVRHYYNNKVRYSCLRTVGNKSYGLNDR